MKTITTPLIIILLIASNFLNAQNGPKSRRVEEIHQKKWQFLVDEAKLSSREATLVQPIFEEYEKTIWLQHSKDREFFKAARSQDVKVKPSYAELNDRYAEVELIRAQLFKDYHLKLRKVLSPESLYRYYKAERDFKRKLLQDFPARGNKNERK